MMHGAIFDLYRMEHPDLDAMQLNVLHLLQADDRMADIWGGFGQRSSVVLAMIISCHKRAAMVPQKSEMLADLTEKFTHLNAAAKCLNDHFSAFLAEPDAGAPEHIVERDGEMQKAIASLDWMRAWLHEEEGAQRYFIKRFSPMSQKNGSEVSAFSVMLCNEFTGTLGQPYYDRVATITDVVYSTEEAVTVTSIRMRLTRDRQAREQAGIRPWDFPDY